MQVLNYQSRFLRNKSTFNMRITQPNAPLFFADLPKFGCLEIGLRGAMAFALALQSVHDLPEGHGQTIFTATTAIVVLTVGMLIIIP